MSALTPPSDSCPTARAGWTTHRLGDLVQKVGSGVTPKGGSDSYVEQGVPFIRSQNVLWGRISLDDVAYISSVQHERMLNSSLQPLDVLLNITGASIGRCAVLPNDFEQGNVNQHVCVIRPKPLLDPHYLAHYLLSDLGQDQIGRLQAGGNREGLNYQQIREFSITCPPLGEQKKIAAILTSVNDKLDVIACQITATEALKQGLMQTLFAKDAGTRRPSAWQLVPFGTIAPIIRREVDVQPNGLFPELGLRSFGKGTFHKPALTGEQVGNKRLFVIKSGDLVLSNVFAWEGSVAVAKPEDDGRFGSHRYITCAVNPDMANAHFIARYLLTPPGLAALGLASPGGAGRNKTLGLAALAEIKVPLPPLEEQNAINDVLKCVESKIETLQQKHGHIQTLKRGLMQKLLTGEWRVKLDNTEPTPVAEAA